MLKNYTTQNEKIERISEKAKPKTINTTSFFIKSNGLSFNCGSIYNFFFVSLSGFCCVLMRLLWNREYQRATRKTDL